MGREMNNRDVELEFAEQTRMVRLFVFGFAIGCIVGSVVLAYWGPMV